MAVPGSVSGDTSPGRQGREAFPSKDSFSATQQMFFSYGDEGGSGPVPCVAQPRPTQQQSLSSINMYVTSNYDDIDQSSGAFSSAGEDSE